LKAKLIIYCSVAIILGTFLAYVPLISLVAVQRSVTYSTLLGNVTGQDNLRTDGYFAAGIPFTYLPLIFLAGFVAGLVALFKAKGHWK